MNSDFSPANAGEYSDWRYRTGHERLDTDHLSIILLAHTLETGRPLANAEDTLRHLETHLAEHMTLEERVMKETGYPDRIAHEEEHHTYTMELAAVAAAYRAKTCGSERITAFLKRFVRRHVGRADIRLVDWLRHAGLP